MDPLAIPLDLLGRAVSAATGARTTGQELLAGGERLINLGEGL